MNLNFSSIDKYELPEVGYVYSVLLPETVYDFDDIKGKTVSINGNNRVCIGVEAHMHAAPWREGEIVGLLVKE